MLSFQRASILSAKSAHYQRRNPTLDLYGHRF